jgi:pimeloyl-ACP methyl ester carboxylesterase
MNILVITLAILLGVSLGGLITMVYILSLMDACRNRKNK